jgi:RNA polymerase sigma-70 factor (ECF subfamily)
MAADPLSPDDRELVDAIIRAGDEAAFRTLYRRYTPRLFQLILRLLGPRRADAEDVLQDVWIHAVRGLPGFRWDAALSTWLTAIAITQTREWWRRRGTQLFEPIEDGHALALAAQPGDRIDLDTAIAQLPDGYRAVLVLHDIEGFTHEEIADRLGVSIGTSKSQLFAARRAMRGKLAPAVH